MMERDPKRAANPLVFFQTTIPFIKRFFGDRPLTNNMQYTQSAAAALRQWHTVCAYRYVYLVVKTSSPVSPFTHLQLHCVT